MFFWCLEVFGSDAIPCRSVAVINNYSKTTRDWKVLYNYIDLTVYPYEECKWPLLKLFIHVGQDFSNEMISLREHVYIKMKVYSRDDLVWSKTEGKTSNLLASHQLGCWASWQVCSELAGAEIFSTYRLPLPSLKVNTSKGKKPSVRALRNFLSSHSFMILAFHSNSEQDCERLTLLWIDVLFIIWFTVTASFAEICKNPTMLLSSKSS